MTTTTELLDYGRSWIEDTSVELVGMAVDVERLTDDQVIATLNKHFEGGWDEFVAIEGEYDGLPNTGIKNKTPWLDDPDWDWDAGEEPTVSRAGGLHCIDCGQMLILFDDDEHYCDATGGRTHFHDDDEYDEENDD